MSEKALVDLTRKPSKSLLLVDIDGVLSLFGFALDAIPAGHWELVDGHQHLFGASGGDRLLALVGHYDLIWCSGWEERANDYLPRALGLPGPLPFLTFDRNPGRGHGHWKLDAINAHAGPTRPLAWIDDSHDQECEAWARARAQAGGPTLLVTTDPATGLTDAHVAELISWEQARSGSDAD